jgi:hypothetical protein
LLISWAVFRRNQALFPCRSLVIETKESPRASNFFLGPIRSQRPQCREPLSILADLLFATQQTASCVAMALESAVRKDSLGDLYILRNDVASDRWERCSVGVRPVEPIRRHGALTLGEHFGVTQPYLSISTSSTFAHRLHTDGMVTRRPFEYRVQRTATFTGLVP